LADMGEQVRKSADCCDFAVLLARLERFYL